MDKKTLQLIGLNLGIAVVNVVTFSDALIGLDLAADMGSMLERAMGYTLIIMSIFIFLVGNYKILSQKNARPMQQYDYVLEDIDTIPECMEALQTCRKNVFIRDVSTATEQVRRLERKRKSLEEILFQKCQAQQGELPGFKQVIDESEMLFIENVKRMLSRMSIFDQQEYETLQSTGRMNISHEAYQAKQQIFQEHFAYIKQQIEKNEAILLEFDRLLTEISKIGDEDMADEETMESIRDVIQGMRELHSEEDKELAQLERKYRM